MEAQYLQFVQHLHGAFQAKTQVAVITERLLHALFLDQPVDERHFLRQVVVKDHAADRGVDELTLHGHRLGMRHVLIVVGGGQINHFSVVPQTNRGEQLDFA